MSYLNAICIIQRSLIIVINQKSHSPHKLDILGIPFNGAILMGVHPIAPEYGIKLIQTHYSSIDENAGNN